MCEYARMKARMKAGMPFGAYDAVANLILVERPWDITVEVAEV